MHARQALFLSYNPSPYFSSRRVYWGSPSLERIAQSCRENPLFGSIRFGVMDHSPGNLRVGALVRNPVMVPFGDLKVCISTGEDVRKGEKGNPRLLLVGM
jgi:hypothetical protein